MMCLPVLLVVLALYVAGERGCRRRHEALVAVLQDALRRPVVSPETWEQRVRGDR